jgi:hypothetical protein
MRIGTWNVEYARGLPKNERRVARIRQASAAIWVLTETHDCLVLGAEYHVLSTEPRPDRRAGERWVAIASLFPFVRAIPTREPVRTVAGLIETPLGSLIIYGTVMPWHTDPGSSGDARSWQEHHRVVPEQAAEWVAIRAAHPGVPLCVAGDFNTDLGGSHYYGTKRGRAALVDGLRAADLVCLTSTDRVPEGWLRDPPIDHICVSAPLGEGAVVVEAWDGTTPDGVRLSDHSALVVELASRKDSAGST